MAVDRLEWIGDDRFASLDDRRRNSEACVAMLDELFPERTLAEWEDVLSRQQGQWDVFLRPAACATTSRSRRTSSPSSSSTTVTARSCWCPPRRSSAAR